MFVGHYGPSFWVGAAVFSHWILDVVVHRRDMPLYDDTAKIGFGVWNYPIIALSLEALLLFGGMIMYMRKTKPLSGVGSFGPPIFGVLMLAIQSYVFFGPPPASPNKAAATALIAYLVFAAVAYWLDLNREPAAT